MSKKLSIEILHDHLTPDLDIEQIIDGINITAEVAGKFEVIDSNRPTILTKTETDIVNLDDVLHTITNADINIIATGRLIERHEDNRTAGFTSVGPNNEQALGQRVSVISMHNEAQVNDVTSHELSHALNLKFHGENYDGGAHCLCEDCVMFPSINSESIVVNSLTRLERLKRSVGLNVRVPKIERPVKSHCEECARQLAANVFNLIQYKSGVFYPSSVIYPSYTKFHCAENHNA